jgi:hypothetical protein
LGGDLQRGGFRRVTRALDVEEWQLGGVASLSIRYAGGGDDTQVVGPLDYALLMTNAVSLGASVVRVTGSPALLAMWWGEHDHAATQATADAAVEDIIHLVALRAEVEREVASAPRDLRALVAPRCAALARDASSTWRVAQALPDARLFKSLVNDVLSRFARIGSAA